MTRRNCVVLAQHRTDSKYNDFVGRYYHFPHKYYNILNKPGIEFVYYEPKKRKGKGVYFGYGRLGKIFNDKREKGQYFVEIIEYKPFSNEVPFEDENKKPRESGPSYNPQNSARKISAQVLDEISLDGSVVLKFTADAHLVKVLGEELIATEVVGILELIKNSYDANAGLCKVTIEKVPGLLPYGEDEYLFNDLDGPVIIIEDDGCGMDRRTIEHGWMRPASTLKTNIKDRLKAEKQSRGYGAK